jgi:polar amino acid transport system permease protein
VGRPVRRDQDRGHQRSDQLTQSGGDADGFIDAVPLRHPGRWIAAVVVLILVGLFVLGAVKNDLYHWDTYRKYLFDKRISDGAWVTVQLTLSAMALGIGLGIVLAVMRLSGNPVLSAVAWVYLWIFRGTPVYLQLVFWGLFTSLYPHMQFGIPWGPTFVHADLQYVDAAFFFAFLGLGLNEAGYMAEIVRAGIMSVGEGQSDAATALGMSWSLTMRRIVLPQAMRVIIPPTGNEVISMLKTTSLVTAVPLGTDLYNQQHQIAGVIFRPIPLLLVAGTWYLAITSVLMVGQYFLEQRFSRGSSRNMTPRQRRALLHAADVTHYYPMAGGGGPQ